MLELIYLFACLFDYSPCILFIFKKDLKSLFKKTLENKGEIGKRKQKRKIKKGKPSHPLACFFPPAQQPRSAQQPRPNPALQHFFPFPSLADSWDRPLSLADH